MDNKKYFTHPEEFRKGKEEKNSRTNLKQLSKMVTLSLNTSAILLNVNELSMSIKRQRLSGLVFFKGQV